MARFLSFMFAMLALALTNQSRAQGCSDAGFCSFGNLKHHVADSSRGGKLQVLLPFGIGDEDVRVFTPGVQYGYQFSHRWELQAKVTANYASGNLGSVSGPGDLYVSGIYTARIWGNTNISAMVALKFPLDDSSLEEGGLTLPMVYQSSIGTLDLISGVSLVASSWIFSIGWQQPLSGENSNHFLPAYWGTPDALAYPPSNEFKRRGDILFRATYSLPVSERLLLQGGILNIYHMGNDTYTDLSEGSRRSAIPGSKGLTMNVTGSIWFTVNARLKAGMAAGIPLVVRDIRPDGLTRHFVLSPEVQWRLGR